MIFVFDYDDKSLEVFLNEKDAIAAYEGIDVGESPCEFWNNEGHSLKAVFTKPNKRGSFSVLSGTYHLVPNPEGERLINMLVQVTYVESESPLKSIEAVRQHLTSSYAGSANANLVT
jgi:hypothetical protein